MPPKTHSKHPAAFIEKHCNEFGLKITSRDAGSSQVASVICMFCTTFGRDVNVGAKRKRTDKPKYWQKGSFRTDNYSSHMFSQHTEKWEEYRTLETTEARTAFFVSTDVPFVSTLHAHGVCGARQLRFLLNKRIVETVIGDMFFHPDDVDGVTQRRALSIFKMLSDDEVEEPAEGRDQYVAEIKTVKRFTLAVKLIALGDSFRSVSRQLNVIREESGIADYGGSSDVTISNYVRIVCAVSLQKLAELMEKVWACSMGFDCSTHHENSYMDIRVRVFFEGRLRNYHVVALPMFERHTGKYMTELIAKLFDAVFTDWRISMIGLSTDGDRTMTGRIRGVVTRIEQMLGPGVVRVWCGLHQLDLVMQSMFESAFDESFLDKLTTLIGFLRRQQNLIARMRSKCPKFCAVRWLSMGKVLDWLALHQDDVRKYLVEKRVSWEPDEYWWIFLHAIVAIVKEANIVFASLQGLTTLLVEQRVRLSHLVATYCRMCRMQGPLSADSMQMVDESTMSSRGAFAVSHTEVRSFVEGLGRWILCALDGMDESARDALVRCCAEMFVQLADGISRIVAERDSSNDSAEELAPVLPHQLICSNMRTLVASLEQHDSRLQRCFSSEDIKKIDKEFNHLHRAYREELELKNSLDSMKGKALSFEDAWAPLGSRFKMLMKFCGGLATVLPNTSTVESDFSRLSLEKNAYRKALTDFSLEGVLHSKQFAELSGL
jgi:hypothetical protein